MVRRIVLHLSGDTEDLMTAGTTSQSIISKPFRSDDDFQRVRNLLIETYPITPTGFNWEVRRWDGWRFYHADPSWNPRWENLVRLCETADGKLVGVAHPEGTGDAHLELHPDYRHIEEEMITWAEEHLAKPTEDGRQRQLRIFVFDYDSPRRALLERRDYEKLSAGGVTRRLRFGNRPLPKPVIAESYTLRTTNPADDADCRRLANLLNAAFKRTFHNAGEFRTFATHAPSFRPERTIQIWTLLQ
jgi:mycothiol synthase